MRTFTTMAGLSIFLLASMVSVLIGQPSAARAEAAYCARTTAPRTARPTPSALAPEVAKTFDIPLAWTRRATFVRCAGRRLLACWVGANLDCGKADTRRELPGATAFCRNNPGATVIPMVATGHATIYDWRCVGTRAVAGKIVRTVDQQGFIAENWQEVR